MSRTEQDVRTMPNRRENAFMLDLMMLRNSLAQNSEAVRGRMSCYPYAWRDIRLMWHLVNKLQNQLMDTMPDRRLAYYQQMAAQAKVIIDIPGPIPKGRNMLISETRLAAITEAAMRGECALCVKEGREVKRCPIRDALLEIAPPETINGGERQFDDCEYWNAASALVQGEDVHI